MVEPKHVLRRFFERDDTVSLRFATALESHQIAFGFDD